MSMMRHSDNNEEQAPEKMKSIGFEVNTEQSKSTTFNLRESDGDDPKIASSNEEAQTITKSVGLISRASFAERSNARMQTLNRGASAINTRISSSTQLTSDPKIVSALRKSRALPVYTKSDSSVYPSYTNLILPYRVVCRQRYQQSTSGHQEQFIKEMCLHERLQPYALGGVRLRREFCDPILDKVGSRDIIKLTIEEERRLEHILKADPTEL